ncbi:hypothetical protein D5086_016323 [Populus alba]|uniref:Uncharacterized protein n=1 Tax=Populus alba TaxID=43335 RepID=A0ACC4BVG6_POPAL
MYTTMIKAYANFGNPREAFAFYSRMLCDQHYVYPNDFTFTYVFSACSKFNGVFEGKQAHAQMIKFPFEFGVHSWNSLLDFYGKVGEEGIVVRRVFDKIEGPDVVSWNCLINGKALELFKEMQVAKVKMDEVIVTTLLSACARLGALDQGRWLHMYIDKHGIKVDAHLSTALIDMYSKCGRIDMAWKVFQETGDKKVFVWSSMIGGLAMHSFGEKAIELFTKMIECGIEPSEITYINILAACTHSAIWRALLSACKLHRNFELGEQVGRILIKMEPQNDMNYVLFSNVYAAVNRWDISGKLRREMKVRDEHELMTTIAAENRDTAGQNTQIVPCKFVCDARVSSFGVNTP